MLRPFKGDLKMSVHNEPQNDLLQLIKDFSPSIDYEGYGVAEFSEPIGSIEGKTVAHFDEFGDFKIQMTVEKFAFEEENNADGLSTIKFNHFWGLPTENRCNSLTIHMPQGTFVATNIGKFYTIEYIENQEENVI